MADGQILITAIGANLTRDMDMFGSQDPYCVIKFGEQDFKTDVDDKEGLTPKWNKSFTIDYFQQGNTIQIEIWDEDPGSDDLIGKTTLNLKDYINDEDEDGIKAVELFNGNDSVGQFNFTISFRQYDNQQEEEEEEEVDEEEIDESYITPEGPGTIIIKPLKAQLEVDHDTFGKQDPYCVIRIGEQVQKTRPHNGGGKNPNWLGHEFPFQRLDENEILFELKDKDAMSDDEIANGSLLIDQILCAPDGSDVPLTVDLLDGGTPVGQLFLKFSFIPQEKQKQEAAGNGRLLIKPIAADLSESGQSQLSTFCICKLGSQKQKTDVRDGQNPYWGSFLPPFKKTTQTEVEVEIRHQHKKKLLGKGKFLIQEALNDENQLVQVYFESKNKLIGSCKLQVKFLPEKEVAKQYTETPRTKNKKEAEGFGGFLQDLQALQAIIQQIFFKIDTDQSGKIDQEELAEFMKQLSQQLNQPPPTQKDVKLTMKKLDENKEGEITLEQLTPYAVQLLKSPETKAFLKNNPNQQVMIQDEEANEKLCREVFATIDSNGDGYISYGEFQDFMAHLAHLCGKSRLDQNQMAQAFNLLASNEDGKITYNEMRKLISNFVYIINSQPETMPDGTLSDDPYVLKKMIKDLKKKCKVTEFGVSKSIGQAKEAKQKFEHFQKYYMDKPPEKEMRMMQELDHIHQTIKQYQLDVMRLGQRANEMAKFDKGAQLENKIRKRENILEKLTKSVMKLQTKNVAQKSKIDSINSEKEYFAQQAFELNKHYNEMKQHKLKQLQNEVGVNNMEMFNLEKQLKQKTNEANGLLDYQKNIEKLYMQACGNTGTEIDKSLVKSKVYNIQRKQFETQSKAINIIIKEKDKLIKHNVNVDRSPNPHAKKFKITNRINKKQKQKFAKEMKNIEDKIKEQQKQVLLEQRKQNKLLEGVQAKYDSLEQQVDELLNDVRFLLLILCQETKLEIKDIQAQLKDLEENGPKQLKKMVRQCKQINIVKQEQVAEQVDSLLSLESKESELRQMLKTIKEYEDGMNNPALFQLAELEEHYNKMEQGTAFEPVFKVKEVLKGKEKGKPEDHVKFQLGSFDAEAFNWSDKKLIQKKPDTQIQKLRITSLNDLIVQIEILYEDMKTKKVIQTEWKYSDLTDDIQQTEVEFYPKNKLMQMWAKENEFGFIDYLSFSVHSLEEVGEDEEPPKDTRISIGEYDNLDDSTLKTIEIDENCILRYVFGTFESALKSTLPFLKKITNLIEGMNEDIVALTGIGFSGQRIAVGGDDDVQDKEGDQKEMDGEDDGEDDFQMSGDSDVEGE